jgi:CheY-like chemotaxis protein
MRKVDILLVEDDPAIRSSFASSLASEGFRVASAVDGLAALAHLRNLSASVVLSDLNMPRMTGYELLSVLRRRIPDVRLVAMSGSLHDADLTQELSADCFYAKTSPFEELIEMLKHLLAQDKKPGIGKIVAYQPFLHTASARTESFTTTCMECLRIIRFGLERDGPKVMSCPHCDAMMHFNIVVPGTLGLTGAPLAAMKLIGSSKATSAISRKSA